MSGDMRKIEAQVEISYGDEDFASELKFTASENDKDPKSRLEDLYGSRYGSDSEASRNVVGWLSKEKSVTAPDDFEEDCYAFENFPTLTISFGKGRSLRYWQLQGDYERQEYPTKFQICLYVLGKKEPYTLNYGNVLVDWDGKNIVWENLDLTDKLSETIEDVSGVIEQGYILNVYKMEVIIQAWNKPDSVSKITRCYDDIIERYGEDEFKNFECIRELSVSDGIGYGIVSGTCSATLLNNKGRKFDLGYLKNIPHLNRRISPYINGKRMGSYYIKKWDISQSDMFVKCDANDRLLDFQDIMYEGRMPRKGETKVTFGKLFQEVFDSAQKHFLNKLHTDIDAILFKEYQWTSGNKTLTPYTVEPYLPKKSVWEVLQMLCNASMSYVYVDNDDVICVRSELFERNICERAVQISPSNAFSIDIPFFADMETNKVEIAYYVKAVKENQELYREKNFKTSVNKAELHFETDKYCVIERVVYGRMNEDNPNWHNEENSDFKFGISFTTDTLNEEQDLIIYGTEYTFEKQTAGYENKASTALNALSIYKYPDCELIQSKNHAEHIAKRLTELYPTGTRSVTSEWRGDESLSLFDKCNITDILKQTDKYLVTYVRNSTDGGFRQEIKGFSIKE